MQPSLEPGLRSWLQQRGLPEQKVQISYYERAGRGLEAKDRIKNGEVLLKIPRRVLLTPEAALQHSSLGGQMEAAGLPGWSILAVAIAEARYGEGPQEWKEYAQALPSSTGCVLEWSLDEVVLLRGSQVHRTALEIAAAAQASVAELQPIVERAETDGLVQQGVLSPKRLRWAFSMLLSRLVRLQGLGNQEALCPWADMINHDCRANTHLDFDFGSQTAVLVSDRSYKPGEQVMASYGQRTSGQLLLSYGFAPTAGENPHDACLLQLSISEQDPLRVAKIQALQKYGLGGSQEFPLKMSGAPGGALQYAAFSDAAPSDPSETLELAEWLFGKGQFPRLDDVDTELLGAEVLRDACKAALREFPESMEAHQRSLAALKRFPATGDSASLSSQNRKALITGVKLQEQKVLQRNSFILQQQIKELSS